MDSGVPARGGIVTNVEVFALGAFGFVAFATVAVKPADRVGSAHQGP